VHNGAKKKLIIFNKKRTNLCIPIRKQGTRDWMNGGVRVNKMYLKKPLGGG
jgi:hypothetical protein